MALFGSARLPADAMREPSNPPLQTDERIGRFAPSRVRR